jgi:hypothetical protein
LREEGTERRWDAPWDISNIVLLLPPMAHITVYFGHAGRSQEGRAERARREPTPVQALPQRNEYTDL